MSELATSGFSESMEMVFTKECKDVKLIIQQIEFRRDFLDSKLVARDVILDI